MRELCKLSDEDYGVFDACIKEWKTHQASEIFDDAWEEFEDCVENALDHLDEE